MSQVLIGLSTQIEMPLIGATLTLGALYRGLNFNIEPS